MKRTMKSTLALIAAMTGAATAAAAASPAGDPSDDAAKAEAAADLKPAWETRIEARYALIDADGDGVVTEEEYIAYKISDAKAEFARMPGREDGLTLAEVKDHYQSEVTEAQTARAAAAKAAGAKAPKITIEPIKKEPE